MQSEDFEMSNSFQIHIDFDPFSYPRQEFHFPQLEIPDSLADFASVSYNDHKNFYSLDNLPATTSFLAVGALLANTDADQNLLNHIQDGITFNNQTNELNEFVSEFRSWRGQYSEPC